MAACLLIVDGEQSLANGLFQKLHVLHLANIYIIVLFIVLLRIIKFAADYYYIKCRQLLRLSTFITTKTAPSWIAIRSIR